MTIKQLFGEVTEQEKSEIVKKLIEKSSPSYDFFIMVALSVAMATFGFLLSSEAIVIGSMLIAPLLFPILSLSLGLTISENKLITRSFQTMIKSLILAIAISAIVTLLFGAQIDITAALLERFVPSFLYVFVAVVAGLAAAYAMIKPRLNETLPGVAIAVALIPPIAVIGIGLAKFNVEIMANAFTVFLMNLIGIILASMVIFSLLHFYTKREVAEDLVEDEKRELEKEEKELKKEEAFS